jgi:hypothetical protein
MKISNTSKGVGCACVQILQTMKGQKCNAKLHKFQEKYMYEKFIKLRISEVD